MKGCVALSCLAALTAFAVAAGAAEYVVFERDVDLDGDGNLEKVVVTGGDDASLRFEMRDGKTFTPLYTGGKNYEATYILDRGAEKHVALLLSYLPSNTELWVFRLRRGEPEEIFYYMADWAITVVPDGFEVTWKKYRNEEEGGYDLITEIYLWDEAGAEYRLKY